MSENDYLAEQVARQRIATQAAVARHPRPTRERRPHGRHAVAAGLHRLASRLDG